jgi:histidinol-phosphate aminotransferase
MEINLDLVMSYVRKNIQNLQPYSSARDEYAAQADVYLDANESPFDRGNNRYPDPLQKQLKEVISTWRDIPVGHIFLGNGSDEVIDLIIRAFCEPVHDNIIVMRPSYGMYKVTADINNVGTRFFDLDENFSFDPQDLLDFFEKRDKILFICSPNNPTGNCIKPDTILTICHNFNGLVVLDEAYIDFADTKSCLYLLPLVPNLAIIQTLSKAVGCAGARLGIGFMHPDIVAVLNKIKPPYNISDANQNIAVRKLKDSETISNDIQVIVSERDKLKNYLESLDIVLKVFPSEANFLLVRFKDAQLVYNYLLSNSIVVRNRCQQHGCDNCLRITVGTPAENELLKRALSTYNSISK